MFNYSTIQDNLHFHISNILLKTNISDSYGRIIVGKLEIKLATPYASHGFQQFQIYKGYELYKIHDLKKQNIRLLNGNTTILEIVKKLNRLQNNQRGIENINMNKKKITKNITKI